MPAFKVKVKWGKEVFKDVEVNTDEEVLLFKATLFSLSGVNPERQKICKYYFTTFLLFDKYERIHLMITFSFFSEQRNQLER